MSSYIKNIKMHEKVLFSLIHFYNSYQNISKVQKNLLEDLISSVVTTQANIFLARDDINQAKKEFIDFEKKLENANNIFARKSIGRKLRIVRGSKYLLFSLISLIYKRKLAL